MSEQKKITPVNISFIGGGNMARALLSGLYYHQNRSGTIHVVDVELSRLSELKKQFGVTTSTECDAQLTVSDVVVLSVKPQQMHEVALKLAPYLKKQLVISIAAGIRVSDLSAWLDHYPVIVRTMPNMPALINLGITGMYATSGVNNTQRAVANAILSTVGQTVWLDAEALLDPLTAISGSGPAYVFYFIEAMQQAAEQLGLSQEQARDLALATFNGAAQLAAQSNETAAQLRERVTSKGGTTYAALQSMEQSGVRDAIVTALKAASLRATELGEEFGADSRRT